ARKDLQILKKGMADRRKELAESLSKQMQAKVNLDRNATIEEQVDQYAALQHLEKILRGEVDRLTNDCRSINKSQLEVLSLKEEIQQTETVAKTFAAEEEKLKVESQAPPRVTLYEDAVISWAKGEKARYRGMAIAAVAALGLSLFGIAFLDL